MRSITILFSILCATSSLAGDLDHLTANNVIISTEIGSVSSKCIEEQGGSTTASIIICSVEELKFW